MKARNNNMTVNNCILRCYIEVPDFLAHRANKRGEVRDKHTENPYLKVKLFDASVSIFSPEKFKEDAVYSLTINRKRVNNSKLYNNVTLSWYGYKPQDNWFSSPPTIELAPLQPIFQYVSNELAQFFNNANEIIGNNSVGAKVFKAMTALAALDGELEADNNIILKMVDTRDEPDCCAHCNSKLDNGVRYNQDQQPLCDKCAKTEKFMLDNDLGEHDIIDK